MDMEASMEVLINNEQVLCDKNIVITEELATSNSVILNNVYPSTWEIDKDYVSRFYMPKDYEDVLITDGLESKDWDLKNNIYTRQNRSIISGTIKYSTSHIMYVRVIPGKTYKVRTSNYGQTNYMYEYDKLDIETQSINSFEVANGHNWTTITAEGHYIACEGFDITGFQLHTTKKVLFSGYIKNSGNIELNPRYPHYATLQALDWSNLLSEGDILNYVITGMKISDALKYLIKDLPGFYLGEVNIGNDEIIAPYNCNEKTPHDVLEYLAEVSGAIWYSKIIDDRVIAIDFCSPGLLESTNNIEYTQEYFTDNNIQDMTYSYNAQDYRNKQVITNEKAQASSLHTETFIYEGGNYRTEYPIGEIVSVKNGLIPYSFATKISGEIAYFTYEYGSDIVYIDNIKTGFIFTIEYYPVINLRQTAYNLDEIERISGVMSGVISRYEKRTDTNNAVALNKIAQSYIDYKSVPEIILTIRTYYKDIFDVGTQVLFNGPLESLKTNYLIRSKTTEMIVIGNDKKIFYTYELSSSFNDENAINYFDNQRRKQVGNLDEDEYISRYIDIPSQTNIVFYDATLTEITTLPGNTLNAELDMEV